MVISMPSRTQAVPSAITILVWNGAQLRRSIRAGIRLRMVSPEAVLLAIGASCEAEAAADTGDCSCLDRHRDALSWPKDGRPTLLGAPARLRIFGVIPR
jgi:hypothetical protein